MITKADEKPVYGCEFGQGFYMGDLLDQPKGLIAEFPDNRFYELDCEIAR